MGLEGAGQQPLEQEKECLQREQETRYVFHRHSLCALICISQHAGGGADGEEPVSHDDKPVKSRFDPAGYDKDLVEALERDIVQTNPNVHW